MVDLHNEKVSTDAEFRATYGKKHPAPFDLGSDEGVDWDQTGAAQNADAAARGSASTASRTARSTRAIRRTSTS